MYAKNSTPARSAPHASLRTSLFLQVFALLAFTAIASAVVAFFLAERELTLRAVQQLRATAHTKETLFEMTISKQHQQLSILARDPELGGLSAIQNLVGFQELVHVDNEGQKTVLASAVKNETIPDEIVTRAVSGKTGPFLPIMTDQGWKSYVIMSPEIDDGKRMGTYLASFDSAALAAGLLSVDYQGTTAEVVLASTEGDDVMLIHLDPLSGRAVQIYTEVPDAMPVIMKALEGEEGVAETEDYAGIRVLAAYRSLPLIGWAVMAKVDRYEVLTPILRLAMNLAGIGLMLVTLLSLSIFFLARRIVGPLEELTKKLNGLEARKWKFSRSIFTGNELEVVDCAADDLTKRLRTAHDHLESIVQERTEELRKQLAENSATLESMDQGLLVTNAEGTVTYVNHEAEVLTGFNVKEMIGSPAASVLQILSRDGAPLVSALNPLALVLKTKQRFDPPKDPEFSLKRQDGTATPLQLRATPIVKGGRCIGVVTVFRDITNERRIDQMKSEFIALVSHQLRTPLSSMRWYLEMLISKDAGPLTTDQEQYVQEVATSNARMVHLVNALLNVSRLELGKLQVSAESIDLLALANEAKATFGLESKNRHMDITVGMEGMEGLVAHSDRGLLQLIIENLLSNAIKYGTAGTSVDIKILGNTQDKTITITISDTGIGIPESQRASIGKKLFRGDNARLTSTDGNGLGLYISHIAAESIGATIAFNTTKEKITHFSVTIPAVVEA